MPCSQTVVIEQWDGAVEDGAWNKKTLAVPRLARCKPKISSLSRRDAARGNVFYQ
jgi:hypothetical protein